MTTPVLAPINSDNMTARCSPVTISQIVFGPILEAKYFRQVSCYIFCSPCSYPFHQTARIVAAELCCTFVPWPRHLSFGVVQLFLQFLPLSIIFPALFFFFSSREFCHFENMWVSASTLLKQNILFSDRNACWSMAAIGQWYF
jgi:hypothetical protein